MMRKGFLAFVVLPLVLGTAVFAGDGTGKARVSVVPWNGYKAAVSLTFDDADRSHVQTAVPALNERGLKATFYLIAGNNNSKRFWTEAAKAGHEIGNHSMKHVHPQAFDDKQATDETLGSQKKLTDTFGTTVYTYAYPYIEITKALRDKLTDTHLAARGGSGNQYMKFNSKPDWLNIPSQMTMTSYPLDKYKGWIDTALKQEAWTVFLIHGIEGTDWGYEPIPKATFYGILDHLANPDIWVAPLGTVASYWRASKILDGAVQTAINGGTAYKWDVPSFFPKGVTLKVKAEGAASVLQSGTALTPDANGVYTVDFNAGSMDVMEAK